MEAHDDLVLEPNHRGSASLLRTSTAVAAPATPTARASALRQAASRHLAALLRLIGDGYRRLVEWCTPHARERITDLAVRTSLAREVNVSFAVVTCALGVTLQQEGEGEGIPWAELRRRTTLSARAFGLLRQCVHGVMLAAARSGATSPAPTPFAPTPFSGAHGQFPPTGEFAWFHQSGRRILCDQGVLATRASCGDLLAAASAVMARLAAQEEDPVHFVDHLDGPCDDGDDESQLQGIAAESSCFLWRMPPVATAVVGLFIALLDAVELQGSPIRAALSPSFLAATPSQQLVLVHRSFVAVAERLNLDGAAAYGCVRSLRWVAHVNAFLAGVPSNHPTRLFCADCAFHSASDDDFALHIRSRGHVAQPLRKRERPLARTTVVGPPRPMPAIYADDRADGVKPPPLAAEAVARSKLCAPPLCGDGAAVARTGVEDLPDGVIDLPPANDDAFAEEVCRLLRTDDEIKRMQGVLAIAIRAPPPA